MAKQWVSTLLGLWSVKYTVIWLQVVISLHTDVSSVLQKPRSIGNVAFLTRQTLSSVTTIKKISKRSKINLFVNRVFLHSFMFLDKNIIFQSRGKDLLYLEVAFKSADFQCGQ